MYYMKVMLPSKLRQDCIRVVLVILTISLIWLSYQLLNVSLYKHNSHRSFLIDYEKDTFLMDGRPFRFISGEMHYFRAPRDRWQDLLRKARAAGLNAISTYIEWNSHETSPGVYNFTGDLDVEHFLMLAAQEKLYVLLRPGPFICGERDFGGLPVWLWMQKEDIILRRNDPTYQYYVEKWFGVLFTRLTRFMYGNGGPIILVQVENEYGFVPKCEKNHVIWLRDLIKSYIYDSAVLYSIDPPHKRYYKCIIDGVYPTVDFGAHVPIERAFNAQRSVAPRGPLVNSELYAGYLSHWEDEGMQRVHTNKVLKTLEAILKIGANVNIYMFWGGTNFGFKSGANYDKHNLYMATVTSYDYDAPLDESGSPTRMYFEIRKVIGRYIPLPELAMPRLTRKENYSEVVLTPVVSVFDEAIKPKPVIFEDPLSFEKLGQSSGFVLYETILTEKLYCNKCNLGIDEFSDRAQVFVDEYFISTLYRSENLSTFVNVKVSQKLSLFVENMGRINHGPIYDQKGILSDVLLDNDALLNWKMYRYPLDNVAFIENIRSTGMITYPMFFSGGFLIESNPADTYLDMSKWNKGVVFVNGYNLGRYWSEVGPQFSLFLPLQYLKKGFNKIVVFEQQKAPPGFTVKFSTQSIFRFQPDVID